MTSIMNIAKHRENIVIYAAKSVIDPRLVLESEDFCD